MNMFRNLAMFACIGLAVGLWIGKPEDGWSWATLCGDQVVSAINFLAMGRPYTIIVLLAIALALFMTRLKY